MVTAADPKNQPAKGKKGADDLQGTWKLVKIEKAGTTQAVKAGEADYFQLTITGDKITVQFSSGQEDGTFKVDAEKKPKSIDISPNTSEDKGKTILGIYDLQGNQLRLCVADAGVKKRPTEFKSTSEEIVVYHLEKEKK
jgi:uncharacterized protein (TIGR03067 family)